MKLKVIWWYLFNREKYRNYKILLWIKDAKEYYKRFIYEGLCWCFRETLPEEFITETSKGRQIEKVIPEYHPEFFSTEEICDGSIDDGFWWPGEDIKSRLKALDKLIQVYKDKLK